MAGRLEQLSVWVIIQGPDFQKIKIYHMITISLS